ncbi:hypothetical protein M501DRAFT_1016981 [Patellaria atrata CBS 101060]|uniref:Uncharacterized protein n=1 Tax=Patellaria atrata CBS 101060 TaxID=1346257 RepID=A0A9P4VRJ1_9PEZI|nr:hypothetical protein M501DRAFT_1016981 [Patellaria atrata CBS 101060]
MVVANAANPDIGAYGGTGSAGILLTAHFLWCVEPYTERFSLTFGKSLFVLLSGFATPVSFSLSLCSETSKIVAPNFKFVEPHPTHHRASSEIAEDASWKERDRAGAEARARHNRGERDFSVPPQETVAGGTIDDSAAAAINTPRQSSSVAADQSTPNLGESTTAMYTNEDSPMEDDEDQAVDTPCPPSRSTEGRPLRSSGETPTFTPSIGRNSFRSAGSRSRVRPSLQESSLPRPFSNARNLSTTFNQRLLREANTTRSDLTAGTGASAAPTGGVQPSAGTNRGSNSDRQAPTRQANPMEEYTTAIAQHPACGVQVDLAAINPALRDTTGATSTDNGPRGCTRASTHQSRRPSNVTGSNTAIPLNFALNQSTAPAPDTVTPDSYLHQGPSNDPSGAIITDARSRRIDNGADEVFMAVSALDDGNGDGLTRRTDIIAYGRAVRSGAAGVQANR